MFMKCKLRIFRDAVICIAVLLASTAAIAQGPNLNGLYVPPHSAFILNSGETPIQLTFGSASLKEIQSQLDLARAANSTSPILLTLTGTYTVEDKPLTLPSKTSLVLYGTIRASRRASATSLIAIVGQSEVGVAGGFLDGRNAHLSGIDVEQSTKVNIDAVTVFSTGKDGILLGGQGNDVWDSGSAITRCDVAFARGNGITVESITQALVLDSFVHDNAKAGIQVGAAYSSIVNNVVRDNEVGIDVEANDNLVSDNEVHGNRAGGVRLESTSTNTAVLRNSVMHSSLGIDLNGNNNLVYANALRNRLDLSDPATGNWVLPLNAPLAAPNSQYFYPPTVSNPHSDPIMNGLSRTDLVIDAASVPNISGVQQAYNQAIQQNPNSVLVLALNGNFTMDGTTPLTLESHTAMILNGSVTVPPKSKTKQVVAAASSTRFVSISGGTINLSGLPIEGISLPSSTMANVDQVTVLNGGTPAVRTGGGMIHLQHGGGYNILHANTVDTGGGRCIWTQESNARYIVLENHVSNCQMDGIDFDSATSNSIALANVSKDNLRYLVFVEQSDSFDKLYGNSANNSGVGTSEGHGIGFYNNATASGTRAVTDKNTAFCNVANVINNGFRTGSISTSTGGVAETAHSFMFNNIANGTSKGILFDTAFSASVQNYFSQTVLSGNKTDILLQFTSGAEPPEFFNPMPATNLALHQPVTASSTAPGSSPEAAVDGLAYTHWIAGRGRHAWLTVDLGADFRFQRVALKQTAELGIHEIELQTSEDGINFVRIRDGRQETERRLLSNIVFSPVTARFVRIRIEKSDDEPAGFEEVSILPQ
jgi:parallel beta-helix repeat protein